MARVWSFFGGDSYRCDLCRNLEDRVVTDSYSGKDICFMCATAGFVDGGLFSRVTMNPEEDGGDNLMEAAKEFGLLPEDDEEEVPV